jgi:GNAT superfamily N-acetyltransferase
VIVRRATATDVGPASAVLARAFVDYPWTRWTVDHRHHVGRIRCLQRLALENVAIPFGDVWVAVEGGVVVACAAWTPQLPDDVWSSTADLHARFEGDRHGPSLAAEAACAHLRPSSPHRTLGTVGTLPEMQRTGIGAAVIAPGIAMSEAERMASYLETSSETNVAFYERLGFQITGLVEIPGGPSVWGMLRP